MGFDFTVIEIFCQEKNITLSEKRDCFALLAMADSSCRCDEIADGACNDALAIVRLFFSGHCEERSDEAVSHNFLFLFGIMKSALRNMSKNASRKNNV